MSNLIIGLIVTALVIFFVWKSKANTKVASDNIARGAAFLESNKEAEGVETTSSGLQYLVLEKGTGTTHPSASSRVNVHYHGTLVDGTVFDSSVDRGEPISFGLNQVIKGWTEGLQLMVEGDKTRLFIPSNLGYGNRSAGKIAAGSVLIFDVELIKIEN